MHQKRRPIIEALDAFQEADPISFHVPGHKHGLLSKLPENIQKALLYDVTELNGLDDLHAPSSIFLEAQQLLAEVYKAEHSFFLVNGTTVGNLAMIRTICEPGDTVLVQRNAHKSVFHAIELAGAQAILMTPEWDERTCTAGAVTALTVQDTIQRYPHAKGILITYPTYYGTAGTELTEIVRCAHEQGIPVLVDEAHGAHFVVGPPFPVSALEYGVDISVQSAHKTLSAMTQASFLHVNSKLIDVVKLTRWLSMLQTSSPSYILLASLDDARSNIATYSEEDKQAFLTWRQQLIDRCSLIRSLEIIEPEDPLKLLLRQKNASGYILQQALEKEGIYTELADERQVLLILPLLTKNTDYPLEHIQQAIASASEKISTQSLETTDLKQPVDEATQQFQIPPIIQSHTTEWVIADHAADRNVASSIIPYPPGIPLILQGELLSREQIREICHMIEVGAKFQGAVRSIDGTVEIQVSKAQGDDSND